MLLRGRHHVLDLVGNAFQHRGDGRQVFQSFQLFRDFGRVGAGKKQLASQLVDR